MLTSEWTKEQLSENNARWIRKEGPFNAVIHVIYDSCTGVIMQDDSEAKIVIRELPGEEQGRVTIDKILKTLSLPQPTCPVDLKSTVDIPTIKMEEDSLLEDIPEPLRTSLLEA